MFMKIILTKQYNADDDYSDDNDDNVNDDDYDFDMSFKQIIIF